MEKYFSIYDTEAAYQLDSSTLPKPNISLIQATSDIKTKKFEVTTVAAPVISNIDSTIDGTGQYTGSNFITLSSTPGAEIKYYVQYFSDDSLNYLDNNIPYIDGHHQDTENDEREYYEYNLSDLGDRIDYIVNLFKDFIENELKQTSNTNYIYNPNNKPEITEYHNYPDTGWNYYYRIYAIAHIGDAWSEMSILTPEIIGGYEAPPEEPPYEEPPYEEPYEEGGEGGEP